MRRGDLGKLIAIGLVASVVLSVIAVAIEWFPVQASEQAEQIDRLWDVVLLVSIPIFVLVELVVGFCIVRFRMRKGQEHEDGPPIHGNTRIEVVWTVIPAVILLALCVAAYVVLRDIEREEPNPLVVDVYGEQFAWSFRYAGPGGGDPIQTDRLRLPEGRQVRFEVHSKDVIHDFWVPAFRMKIDAVPGRITEYEVTPTRNGTYAIVCAELCGLGHATMRQSVTVEPEGQFNAWLREQQAQVAEGEGGPGSDTPEGGASGGEAEEPSEDEGTEPPADETAEVR